MVNIEKIYKINTHLFKGNNKIDSFYIYIYINWLYNLDFYGYYILFMNFIFKDKFIKFILKYLLKLITLYI